MMIENLETLVKSFIQNRLEDKLEKEKDENKREKLKQAYEIKTWLSDAARRANQIQLVSHAVKFLNPNAKGTSIYLSADSNTQEPGIVSTLSLLERKDDVVGNAAALDVFKFLQLADEQGKTILVRMLENDSNLRAALPGSEQEKDEWFEAFANITRSKGTASSHQLAKQIYFPVEDGSGYHLIAPLFPTSLSHAVFEQIQTRFDEATKEARKARREKKPHLQGYREYLNLAVQTAGGSKPQNISQLNSIRGGKMYLLPSSPPIWKSIDLKPPLKMKSVFNLFYYRVRKTIKELRRFLTKVKNCGKNVDIRDTRAAYIAEIGDQLLFFASQIQNLPAGWSLSQDCQLSISQSLWLDPFRAAQDAEWAEKRATEGWRTEVSRDFALWLNSELRTDDLRFGDDEYKEWKGLLKRELSLIEEAI